MKLKDKLNNLCQSKDLKGIEDLVKDAKGEVTFWGGRKITVDGYEGMVFLNKASKKVLDLGEQVELNLTKQKTGARICANLTNLYKSTDQIAKKNIITLIILFFREFKIWDGLLTERNYVRKFVPFSKMTITIEEIKSYGSITDEDFNNFLQPLENEYSDALNS